jgi:hypothetical protein
VSRYRNSGVFSFWLSDDNVVYGIFDEGSERIVWKVRLLGALLPLLPQVVEARWVLRWSKEPENDTGSIGICSLLYVGYPTAFCRYREKTSGWRFQRGD